MRTLVIAGHPAEGSARAARRDDVDLLGSAREG